MGDIKPELASILRAAKAPQPFVDWCKDNGILEPFDLGILAKDEVARVLFMLFVFGALIGLIRVGVP